VRLEPYYDDGQITIFNADCRDVLPSMRGADLVLTSPPYNIGKEYERTTPLPDYLDFQRSIIEQAAAATNDGGSVCWQVGNHVDSGEVFPLDCLLYPLFKDAGLTMRNRIVWTFGHGLHCLRRFSGRHETIMWFSKGAPHFHLDAVRIPSKYPNKRHYKGPRKGELSGNPLGKNPGDVWDIPNVQHNHPEKTDHPCQFPVELARRLIAALVPPGGIVIDPFMGSGTTLAAAQREGRRAIGVELSEAYCEIAVRRLSQTVLPLEIPA
jgi:adenine-specific DNA-methyltransferase